MMVAVKEWRMLLVRRPQSEWYHGGHPLSSLCEARAFLFRGGTVTGVTRIKTPPWSGHAALWRDQRVFDQL
jgi:hypothetical protein